MFAFKGSKIKTWFILQVEDTEREVVDKDFHL